jgi:prevent-host-death family protein
MARRHSIAEARNSLPRLVREAESGKPVELTRRGKAVAMLIGRRDYDRLTSDQRSFGEAYAALASEINLPSLAIDPDEVFASVRDRAPARKVTL